MYIRSMEYIRSGNVYTHCSHVGFHPGGYITRAVTIQRDYSYVQALRPSETVPSKALLGVGVVHKHKFVLWSQVL